MPHTARLLGLLTVLPLGGLAGQQAAFVGYVRDSITGAAMPGVSVAVAELAIHVESDSTGFFRLPGIETGTYTIFARYAGFRPYAMRLNVTVDDERDLPLGLLNLTREYEAIFFGSVADSAGRPLPGVTVSLAGRGTTTQTGADGQFELTGVVSGNHTVMMRRVGYDPWSVEVEIDVAEPMRVNFGETTLFRADAVELAELLVEGEEFRASSIMDDFLFRMRTEQGTFLTYEDIEKIDPVNTSDVIRRVAGFNTLQNGQVTSRRAGTSGMSSFGPCEVRYYIDGTRSMAPTIDVILPHAIAGIEIYRGSATVPPIFNSPSDSNCGVIAIWTKDGIGGR